MLHLKTIWRAGTYFADVEYATPLEKCRENYYLIKLDSLYSSAVENDAVITPVSFQIHDSAYIASINSDEINFNQPIKNYSEHIANLLNGRGVGPHTRSSQSFLKTLLNYSPVPPSAVYHNTATDTTAYSRFFSLNLPAKTFLFSNNKYVLNALGYSDEQILYIPNVQNNGIPQQIIDISAQLGEYGSLKSIYIAPNNQTTSRLPVPAPKSQIKWLNNDTFESVYFPDRRESRYQNVENLSEAQFRVRRDTVRPVLETSEKSLEILRSDTPADRLKKIQKLQMWDNKAIVLQVTQSSTRTPFNMAALAPKTSQQTEIQAKYNYWRKAIVSAIYLTIKSTSSTPQLVIPSDYLDFSVKEEFLKPIELLATKDPKVYVQLGASAAIISYYNKLLNYIDRELNTQTDAGVVAVLTRNKTEITNAYTAQFTKNDDKAKTVRESRARALKRYQDEQSVPPASGNNPSLVSSGESISTNSPPSGSENAAGSKGVQTAPNSQEEKPALETVIADVIVSLQNQKQLVKDKSSELNKSLNTFNTNLQQALVAKQNSIIKYNQYVTKLKAHNLQKFDGSVAILNEIKKNKQQITTNRGVILTYITTENIGQLENNYTTKTMRILQKLKDLKNNPNTTDTQQAFLLQKINESNSIVTSIQNRIALIKKSVEEIKKVEQGMEAVDTIVTNMSNLLTNINIKLDANETIDEIPTIIPVDEGSSEDEPPTKKEKTDNNPEDNEDPVTPSSASEIEQLPEEDFQSADEEQDEYDERTADDFIMKKKYAIGFVHFCNDPIQIDTKLTVTQTTSATDVLNFFHQTLDNQLLNQGSLNMAFKPVFEKNTINDVQDEKSYRIRNKALSMYNNSHLQISLHNNRYVRLLRLESLVDQNQKITIYAHQPYAGQSDSFDIVNPFNNDFQDNLPLILSPRNAGLFNTYATGIGETSSLGLVDKIGRVKNAVSITMRPSENERFTIDFRTTELIEKYPTRDYILYLYFNVEPL